VTAADATELVAVRVERLLGQLHSGPDPRAGEVAEELVCCLVQLYGDGLQRIVALVGPEQSAQLCADPLVESLLLVHDLHPADAETRIGRALESVRSRTGEVDYLGIDEAGVVRLRLRAAGHGCRSSVQPVRQLLEATVRQAAPESTGVEVEVPAPEAPLLQVSLRPGMDRPSALAGAGSTGPGRA